MMSAIRIVRVFICLAIIRHGSARATQRLKREAIRACPSVGPRTGYTPGRDAHCVMVSTLPHVTWFCNTCPVLPECLGRFTSIQRVVPVIGVVPVIARLTSSTDMYRIALERR